MLAIQLLSALGVFALANAQSEATANPTIPAIPSSTAEVPTIEGALVYDGPPVIGFTGPGGNASIQNGNPAATYEAILPPTNFDNATGTTITGTITGTAGTNGTGVMFSVNFTGLPDEAAYGPFVYHIHALPVPADGNCTATMGHLDPTNRGELHACEAAAPQTCQAGDLAGKHGNITATPWTVMYSDLYLSTTPGSPYFFGDKSIVIHSTNATRLTCANFSLVSGSSAPSGSNSTGTSGGSGSSSASATGSAASPTIQVAAATPLVGDLGLLVAGGLVAAFGAWVL